MVRKILLLAVLTICAAQVSAKEWSSSTYRFKISFPDDWFVTNGTEANEQIIVWGGNGRCQAAVRVYSFDEALNVRKLLKGKVDFGSDGYKLVRSEKADGRFNLLQHSIINYYRDDNGIHLKQLVTFRARTLFVIRVVSPTDDFSDCDAIFDSVDIDLTTWGYFQIAKSRMGWVWGSLFLTFFPLLCYLTGRNLRKWLLSCKSDKKALHKFEVLSSIAIALLAAAAVLLRDCPALALWVTVSMVAVWLVFVSNSRFLKKMFHGMFSKI